MCVVLFPVSLRELVFWGWWNIYLWTPLCYFVAILHLFSQSSSIVLLCGGQLLNVTFGFLSARCILWPGFDLIRVSCHWRRVAGLRMLYKVNSSSNHCLFSELQSASTRIRHTRAAAAAHLLVFEVSRSSIMMSNRPSFTLQFRNIVKKARDQMGWVLRVFQSQRRSLMLHS